AGSEDARGADRNRVSLQRGRSAEAEQPGFPARHRRRHRRVDPTHAGAAPLVDDRDINGFDDIPRQRDGLTSRRIAVIGVITFAVLGLALWLGTRPRKAPEAPVAKKVETVPEGTRNVTLYFADLDQPEIHGETRELAVGHRLDEQVHQVIDALIAGPSGKDG